MLVVAGNAGAAATGHLGRTEPVLQPGGPDLFKASVPDPVEGLRDDRMIRGVADPVEDLVTDVAGIGPDGEGDLATDATPGHGLIDVADDDVGTDTRAVGSVTRGGGQHDRGSEQQSYWQTVSHLHSKEVSGAGIPVSQKDQKILTVDGAVFVQIGLGSRNAPVAEELGEIGAVDVPISIEITEAEDQAALGDPVLAEIIEWPGDLRNAVATDVGAEELRDASVPTVEKLPSETVFSVKRHGDLGSTEKLLTAPPSEPAQRSL